ncbi:hypothetical protein NECAME_11355 [Necator americanus]|uniref:Cysteine rich repeat-containing domain protein n=1 Tax=Necator americanus TaxID=51031 RepID=W2T5Y4_NECAM|nr:hypothetical protein NECAME_11355 [Necator americanus]ETN77034.1 hypothetical protein NECAME_11355 [Necator americanus]
MLLAPRRNASDANVVVYNSNRYDALVRLRKSLRLFKQHTIMFCSMPATVHQLMFAVFAFFFVSDHLSADMRCGLQADVDLGVKPPTNCLSTCSQACQSSCNPAISSSQCQATCDSTCIGLCPNPVTTPTPTLVTLEPITYPTTLEPSTVEVKETTTAPPVQQQTPEPLKINIKVCAPSQPAQMTANDVSTFPVRLDPKQRCSSECQSVCHLACTSRLPSNQCADSCVPQCDRACWEWIH